jgi:hypothetical protein
MIQENARATLNVVAGRLQLNSHMVYALIDPYATRLKQMK